jgi:hypothetical protein
VNARLLQHGATIKVALVWFVLPLFLTAFVYQFPVASVIDVGSGRDAPFIQGFSFRENLSRADARDLDARWSNGHAEIRFVGVGAQNGILKLRYAAPRPQNPAQVQVFANGVELAHNPPSNDFQEQSFSIERSIVGIGGDLVIALNSDTFRQPPDTRALGLLVESAGFDAQGAPVIPSPRALFYFPALVVLAFFVARAWSGSERIALVSALASMVLGAASLYFARVETAYFLAPLFWFTLLLCASAYVFLIALQRLTNALSAPALDTRTMRLLFLAMILAFVLRMIFAVTPGYIVDVQDYIVWSYKTVTYGLGTMYSAVNGLWISDQSPGLNYILHGMGLVYRGIFAPDFLYPAVAGDPMLRDTTTNPALLADPIQRTLLRLPMLFADVITGALIFVTARKYIAERGLFGKNFVWLAAFAFWFNPAVLWNGAYWGQTDAIHTLLILICFLLLVFTQRVGLAFFILGIAAFTKPQAMIFGPLLLLAAYKTSKVSGDLRGLKRVARAFFFGALGSALMLFPVLLTGGAQGLLAYFGDTVGHHPILSANAHNVWWFLFRGNIDVPDTRALFPDAPLSFRAFSIISFAFAYALTLLKAWRVTRADFFALGAFLAFAFFMLPTEIHENYGYALLPLLAIAMTRDKPLMAFFVVISTTMTLNYALHDPNLYARFGLSDPDAQWATARWFNSIANIVILALWTIYLFMPISFSISNGARNLNAPTE